jgi:glycosyltransferase involved in cell wall biosynthesis
MTANRTTRSVMNSQYQVSIIIPVYNAAQFLTKAVESVVSLPETGEVLLIDDGSKDDSLNVCKQLAQQYAQVKLFQHPGGGNKGAAASRNVGIVNAGCEFVSFLDADDYYLPNRFTKEQEVFAQHPDADGVYGCNEEVFETEKAKELYLANRSSIYTTITEKVEPERLFKCLIFGGYGEFHTSTITLRKRAFEKAGLFNTDIRYVEDTELWLKLSLKCRLYPGSIDEPQTVRIVHENNSIHALDKIKPYKDLMYQVLFDWALKEQLPFSVKNDFFNAVHWYVKGNDYPVKQLFWEQVKRNPSMIASLFFAKKIKQLYL